MAAKLRRCARFANRDQQNQQPSNLLNQNNNSQTKPTSTRNTAFPEDHRLPYTESEVKGKNKPILRDMCLDRGVQVPEDCKKPVLVEALVKWSKEEAQRRAIKEAEEIEAEQAAKTAGDSGDLSHSTITHSVSQETLMATETDASGQQGIPEDVGTTIAAESTVRASHGLPSVPQAAAPDANNDVDARLMVRIQERKNKSATSFPFEFIKSKVKLVPYKKEHFHAEHPIIRHILVSSGQIWLKMRDRNAKEIKHWILMDDIHYSTRLKHLGFNNWAKKQVKIKGKKSESGKKWKSFVDWAESQLSRLRQVAKHGNHAGLVMYHVHWRHSSEAVTTKHRCVFEIDVPPTGKLSALDFLQHMSGSGNVGEGVAVPFHGERVSDQVNDLYLSDFYVTDSCLTCTCFLAVEQHSWFDI